MSRADGAGEAIGAGDLRLALPGRDGPLPVLDGVELSVATGEFVALIGPSGCGKSRLLAVLAGLQAADAGEVRIAGRPAPQRLGRLALMPQADALLPWRTVIANVALASRLAGADAPLADARARRLLARYGLAGFEDHYPHALSGGMRQRVALARTVLSSRPGWLLDEPFGALDALTRAELHADLAAVHAEHGASVLLVTHDIDEAILLADRVLVSSPRPSRIVADIPVDLPRPRPSSVIADPRFAALKLRLRAELGGVGLFAGSLR